MERARTARFRRVFACRLYNMENAPMHSFRVLLAAIVLTACAASPRPAEPWKIQLKSSGGFAGQGAGTYTVESTGKVTAASPFFKGCSYSLSADELRQFRKVLGAAKPETWKKSYMPENRCCDRFEWVLTFEEGPKSYTTEWLDSGPPMPEDLTAVIEMLSESPSSIRSTAPRRCPQQ
jgi:hypothetical protein